MKKEYDFKKAKRGPVVRVPPGKERITIRIDEDVLDWFRTQVEDTSGGNYQTLINYALRSYIHAQETSEKFEEVLRRVLREELRPKKRAA
jgi:uncharacterized protein (DUF4415 family)